MEEDLDFPRDRLSHEIISESPNTKDKQSSKVISDDIISAHESLMKLVSLLIYLLFLDVCVLDLLRVHK